ncbi:MAG TPA: peptidylprolyl isomerase [Vulgatibacter sp.]|nr:peptidylprolyl isomerase [Vulgatibacter sp.]
MKTRLLTLLALLSFAGTAGATVIDRIACVVDDQPIMLSEVEERAAALRMRAPGASRAALLRDAAEELIAEKLMDKQLALLAIDVPSVELQVAIDDVVKQNGLPSEEALRAAVERQGMGWDEYRATLRRQLAQMKLINLKVRSQVKVSDDEVKRRYAEAIAVEKGEEEVHASHILVMVGEGADAAAVEEARARAAALADRAREGADFTALAADHSDGPSKASGGDLGWFRRGEMVRELEQTAFAMQAGEISDPVRTRFGWHVIKLEERRKVAPKPLAEMAGQIRESLYREEMERQTDRFLEGLKKDALIDYPMAELAPRPR